VTHGNVEEARRDFHQSPGKFEIALLDNTMPKTTGLEFAQELLALRPGLPIILMTGSASANVINRARRCGIARVLAKPADSLELGRALYEVLHP
jgi:DNA-binding NtrC family response regulator